MQNNKKEKQIKLKYAFKCAPNPQTHLHCFVMAFKTGNTNRKPQAKKKKTRKKHQKLSFSSWQQQHMFTFRFQYCNRDCYYYNDEGIGLTKLVYSISSSNTLPFCRQFSFSKWFFLPRFFVCLCFLFKICFILNRFRLYRLHLIAVGNLIDRFRVWLLFENMIFLF